tara:strand:- start:251 stop:556 length:306 start_codon:yes stop_codon:yes gene_type:complete
LDIVLVVEVEVDQHTLLGQLLLKDAVVEVAVHHPVSLLGVDLRVRVEHMELGVVLLVQTVKDLLQVEVVEVEVVLVDLLLIHHQLMLHFIGQVIHLLLMVV